ncbi:bifunctional hydroxymethylpyrimidine kinase/phosphomethylpyrimidine kinase [Anaplasma bovis]|uniref:bifunctional hydroxymethylpyrimidine kinase/phosphomethylpyrimidine kinase n=1 Tax=Anaplasma bovis TaxID=186733 RepID=UPI002FEEB216
MGLPFLSSGPYCVEEGHSLYKGKVLSIAGSDPSGGAGVQADIKTITALGCYAATCITSITAQNTTGVFASWDMTTEVLEKQMTAVLSDIKMDSIKIGMLPVALIDIISELLPSDGTPIILDPVMVATSGAILVDYQRFSSAISPLASKIFLITPNITEAETISGMKIRSKQDMIHAGTDIMERTNISRVLVKGGKFSEKYIESILVTEHGTSSFSNEYIPGVFHGTGCTLSSAIASFMAQKISLEQSIHLAIDYLVGTLKNVPKIGNGNSPVFHNYSAASALQL